MAKYYVTALVTASLHAEVDATSQVEARELASGLDMPSLCHDCSGSGSDPKRHQKQWCNSGEFDGEAMRIRAEKIE